MSIATQLKNDLKKLAGNPCWQASYEFDELTLLFGNPTLQIHEMQKMHEDGCARKSRNVWIDGEYGIYLSDLTALDLSLDGKRLSGLGEDISDIHKALSHVVGQILERVSYSRDRLEVTMNFDLGYEIKAWTRHGPGLESWTYQQLEGWEYSILGNGTVCYGTPRGDEPYKHYILNQFEISV